MDNLLFANIPHSYNNEDFRTWVEQHGLPVNDIKLIRDLVSGSSPSFARVELSSEIDDRTVEALNRESLGNGRLFVRRGRSPLDD